MRTLSLMLVLSIAACGQAPVDTSDQLDPPVGKADGASKPSGAYTNATPHYGELSTLTLNADHTFTRSEIVACAGGGTCDPLVQSGTYLFTHSTTTSNKFIRFYADDGSDLDRYQWKFSRGQLEMTYDGEDQWFTLAKGSTCEAAGGTCAPLVPDACEFGQIGDATEYSCGGGLGVECCLPMQADNGCTADTDCSGALPQYCRQCDDGSTVCAHWSCVQGACNVVSCPS